MTANQEARDELDKALRNQATAYEFLEKCLADPASVEVGARRDAYEWVSEAGKQVNEAFKKVMP